MRKGDESEMGMTMTMTMMKEGRRRKRRRSDDELKKEEKRFLKKKERKRKKRKDFILGLWGEGVSQVSRPSAIMSGGVCVCVHPYF